jgi:hypothetical protein
LLTSKETKEFESSNNLTSSNLSARNSTELAQVLPTFGEQTGANDYAQKPAIIEKQPSQFVPLVQPETLKIEMVKRQADTGQGNRKKFIRGYSAKQQSESQSSSTERLSYVRKYGD